MPELLLVDATGVPSWQTDPDVPSGQLHVYEVVHNDPVHGEQVPPLWHGLVGVQAS